MSKDAVWRRYHEATKHTVEKLRRSRHFLDWDNMPDPFRHYAGAPILDLPADAPPPEANALEVLAGFTGAPANLNGPEFLSQLLLHTAAISASKMVPSTGHRYALRVNPSSGNLHPTEFHFATRGLRDWPDGLYHYRPSSHMAEQRATGDWVTPLGMEAPLVFILTSIAWREAWKYQARAYRYCCHDMGHAWEALTLAARASGYHTRAVGRFPDDELTKLLQLQDEWPMLLVGVDCPANHPSIQSPQQWFGGAPNRLSEAEIPYPLIQEIHEATKALTFESPLATQQQPPNRLPVSTDVSFATAARRRRSALDFRGGRQTISLAQLQTLLQAAHRPLQSDFGHGFIDLWLYVHRVGGLEPGLYRANLDCVRTGDQRVTAAGLSLGQDLAGNACVAFSMIADLDRITAFHGDRGYRYAHFEAGAIGHRLYLAAEAMGFQSTGIGAFYDDAVHRYLDIEPGQGQVIYHFACGYAVKDERLAE
jgi:SagB-type dehydrogenase family enzyme